MKKGAMFGLDARIALAIFGALSVISSAALYSAIQEAKVMAFYTDLLEIGKAWEQYNLDLARDLTIVKSSGCSVNCFYKVKDLQENTSSLRWWKGPYLPYELESDYTISYTKNGDNRVVLRRKRFEPWTSTTDCVANTRCYLTIQLGGNIDQNIVEALDKKIDGKVNKAEGFFRWSMNSGSAKWDDQISFLYLPVKN